MKLSILLHSARDHEVKWECYQLSVPFQATCRIFSSFSLYPMRLISTLLHELCLIREVGIICMNTLRTLTTILAHNAEICQMMIMQNWLVQNAFVSSSNT